MRTVFLLLALFVAVAPLFAQQDPTFQFTLYFTDSQGNKDSLVLGYAPDANSSDILDPQYGEIDISDVPFDTVLDIRMEQFDYVKTKLLKKQIYKVSCDDLSQNIGGGGMMYLYTKYPPLDITWNKELFDTYAYPCHDYTNIIADEAPFVDCSSCPSIFYLQFADHRYVTFEEYYNYEKVNVSLEDGTIGLAYAYYFFFLNKPWATGVKDVETPLLHIRPSIATDEVYIDGKIDYNATATIVGTTGIVYSCTSRTTSTGLVLDIASLPKGVYIIHIPTREGKQVAGRFVKL
jgi:hypothetical protein